MIKVKRIYDKPDKNDGQRLLVDRLWPRGISKEKARLDGWFKQIAPSDDLRHWFDHDPDKWPEFQKRYEKELSNNSQTKEIIEAVKKSDTTTLLFSAHEERYNNAVALKAWLEKNT
jgi:uncharacterized protein YeaO (DUF488 family)